jgi:hypothetical protein
MYRVCFHLAEAEAECTLSTPCTPAPKDGKARYDMPGPAYSPAKAAEERFLAKMQADAAKAEGAPAPSTSVYSGFLASKEAKKEE